LTAATGERERLLALATDVCLAEGVSTLTLRSLGTAVGSNNRMLLYYFGSKERLVLEALAEAARRHWVLSDAVPAEPGEMEAWLCRSWRALVAPANRAFMRLFLEVAGLAVQHPDRFTGFVASLEPFTTLVVASLRNQGAAPAEARDLATEIVALWRGLQYELAAGGDVRRVNRVHDRGVRRILADLAAEVAGA
jgi:AcrR family transcriptional regulator